MLKMNLRETVSDASLGVICEGEKSKKQPSVVAFGVLPARSDK